MNCLNCHKLDWEIESEKGKSELGWGRVLLGITLGVVLMLGFWFFAIKYYNSIMKKPRQITIGQHSFIERDGALISWYSFEGINYKENVTDMQQWKREVEEISSKKASKITFKNYVPVNNEERDIINSWAKRIDYL